VPLARTFVMALPSGSAAGTSLAPFCNAVSEPSPSAGMAKLPDPPSLCSWPRTAPFVLGRIPLRQVAVERYHLLPDGHRLLIVAQARQLGAQRAE
jgi:hypothetical protein